MHIGFMRAALGAAIVLLITCDVAVADDNVTQSAHADGRSTVLQAGRDVYYHLETTMRRELGKRDRATLQRISADQERTAAVLEGLIPLVHSLITELRAKRASTTSEAVIQAEAIASIVRDYVDASAKTKALRGLEREQVQQRLDFGDLTGAQELLTTPSWRVAANWAIWSGLAVAVVGATGAGVFWSMGESAVNNLESECSSTCTRDQRARIVADSQVRTYDALTTVSLVMSGVGLASGLVGLVLLAGHQEVETKPTLTKVALHPTGLSVLMMF